MTIEEDVAEIRATLNYLDQFRTLEPQHEDRDDALAALDRIVASHDEHAEMRLENERIRNKAVDVMLAAEKERDELLGALQEIQRIHIARGYCLWAQDIARAALQRTVEVKSPRA